MAFVAVGAGCLTACCLGVAFLQRQNIANFLRAHAQPEVSKPPPADHAKAAQGRGRQPLPGEGEPPGDTQCGPCLPLRVADDDSYNLSFYQLPSDRARIHSARKCRHIKSKGSFAACMYVGHSPNPLIPMPHTRAREAGSWLCLFCTLWAGSILQSHTALCRQLAAVARYQGGAHVL
jgi:hypothetical protein